MSTTGALLAVPDAGTRSSAAAEEPSTSSCAVEEVPPPAPSAFSGLIREIFCHWTGALLIFVPLGYLSAFLHWSGPVVFAINFLAMLPLAYVISASVDTCSVVVGHRMGSLIEAFLGKSVEQVMSVQCLRAGLLDVLKGNLMGSMHWCLLLVLGMSICAAGMVRKQAIFGVKAASAQMTCQIVASTSIVLPTMYKGVAGTKHREVLLLSRLTSWAIMFTYVAFIVFHISNHVKDSFGRSSNRPPVSRSSTMTESCFTPKVMSSLFLMVASILISVGCSQFVVDTIQEVSETFGVPEAFIGCTLLPIMGNTAEHVNAVTHAVHGNMDVAISIAVGSATQIALFVVPLAVLYGWWLDVPMTLNFREFDAAVMLLSVFLCSQVLQHGASNWLHGAMLMTTYLLIAIISWFIPETK